MLMSTSDPNRTFHASGGRPPSLGLQSDPHRGWDRETTDAFMIFRCLCQRLRLYAAMQLL